jgi:hypothetical protein
MSLDDGPYFFFPSFRELLTTTWVVVEIHFHPFIIGQSKKLIKKKLNLKNTHQLIYIDHNKYTLIKMAFVIGPSILNRM